MFFYRLFVLLLFAIKGSITLRCYSCGDENIFLGQEYPSPSPCEEMEKSDNLEQFVIECPEEYLGCITQAKGKELMRTCDTLAIDDCETANGITYCYCSTDLCNGKKSHMDAHKSSRDINYPSDDEDYSDGSGFGHINTESEEEHDKKHSIIHNGSSRASMEDIFKVLVFSAGSLILIKTLFSS